MRSVGRPAHGPPGARRAFGIATRAPRQEGRTRMSRANVEVVQRFEDAFVRGDMDEVLSLVSPDIVVHEAPSLPYPGDHRGHEGFLKLTDAFNSVWEIVSYLDLTFFDADDTRVVVLVAYD